MRGLSLKFNDRYDLELIFPLNSNLRAYLQGSRLKFIFHCTVHLEIFVRSWFRLTELMMISSTVENKEVSSVKRFGLNREPFCKSFM